MVRIGKTQDLMVELIQVFDFAKVDKSCNRWNNLLHIQILRLNDNKHLYLRLWLEKSATYLGCKRVISPFLFSRGITAIIQKLREN